MSDTAARPASSDHGAASHHHGHVPHGATAVVVTVSDRSARGERPDRSGPRAAELLEQAGLATRVMVVPDGADSVREALLAVTREGADLVLTTGGTGVGPRDQTPEGTRPLLTRELPGVAELLRADGVRHTPTAALGRGVAGLVGTTLVVNLPGSTRAVEQGLAVLLPLLGHVLEQVRGADHHEP